ncbi:hypothetical protein PF008_g25860 [Phytophthora fragariae]|uniref:Uncharacterized protein n=1 Tax=Phytophthora fragariae TaxID=53985 RepID=A0A6G0QIQ5_9STRA|nr:hypothetical protein PF008_g25860 [Phytophthora fragariae]
MEVFVLTVLIYVCGFCVVQRRQGWWRRSSHRFQAADLRQQVRARCGVHGVCGGVCANGGDICGFCVAQRR